MPRLMKKQDWMRTVADVGVADGIWYENISAPDGHFPLEVPEKGMYHVILVKIGNVPPTKDSKCRTAHGYIGYCRDRYRNRVTTAEIMDELREGEL